MQYADAKREEIQWQDMKEGLNPSYDLYHKPPTQLVITVFLLNS